MDAKKVGASSGLQGEKKDDDEGFVPFHGLDKGVVLQEKNIFNETPLNPKKCCQLLTKLLYLVTQGERFTKTEATDVFFAVTKLFQSKDIPLRRMVYLVLKELINMSDDVIMVMASLTKDINTNVDVYKANAIRVLTGITDSSMLNQIERYLKQSIVDKEPYVASAALVSGVHLMNTNADVVKRWVSEVQEALQSKSPMVQYHALGLLHQIKKHDKLAVSKLVHSMTKSNVRSVYAHCMLIRIAAKVLQDEASQGERSLYQYLESCLRHKSEVVMYEAARAIANLKDVSTRELTPAVTVLQLLLSSPKPAQRFAAVHTLNAIAQNFPVVAAACNLDLENLITDSNRSIATLAITTLLKTGTEAGVDRLMKQIGSFMSDISDEFKIVVVQAIRTLCVKFPQKQRSLMTFLAGALRDEGGFDYKKSIVDTLLQIVTEMPDSKETALTHLCEFIEDCEFTYLSTKILHVLGREGPQTLTPTKYIRYIYNRVSLENAAVRSAAVSALARFGTKLPEVRQSVVTLLRRCLCDTDDEVRDRATFFLNLLEKDYTIVDKLTADFHIPIVNLEHALHEYRKNPGHEPFDISKVSLLPLATKKSEKKERAQGSPMPSSSSSSSSSSSAAVSATGTPGADPTSDEQSHYAAQLASVPQMAALGPLFRSSRPVALTESETEYVVSAVKHTFKQHLVFQLNVTNTLEGVRLENLSVKLDVSSVKGLKVEFLVPAAAAVVGVPAISYVAVSRQQDAFSTGSIPATLKFRSKEIDPQTGEADETGYDDEYQIEDIPLATSDYMQRVFVSSFQQRWDELGDEAEVVETYSLSQMKSLQDAVKEVTEYLGMQPAERSDQITHKNKHILYLGGQFLGGVPVLTRVRMKFTEGAGVQIEVTVRSGRDEVSTAVASALG